MKRAVDIALRLQIVVVGSHKLIMRVTRNAHASQDLPHIWCNTRQPHSSVILQ